MPALFWFRRDLRLEDNHGLYEALSSHREVIPAFIFDTDILEKLPDKDDRRVNFIYQTVSALKTKIEKYGSALIVEHGKPQEIIPKIAEKYDVQTVFTNRDYEPSAIDRDELIKQDLSESGIEFKTYKDQVIFEKDEITKADGKPYSVFTPYSRKWKSSLAEIPAYNSLELIRNLKKLPQGKMPSLKNMGFLKSEIDINIPESYTDKIQQYHMYRDFPAVDSSSHLGTHLRFGTLSIRQLVKKALYLNEVFLNQLIWREFFMMILWHFPHVELGAFNKKYEQIAWLNNPADFDAWCNGNTGYPIVDAGMRQLLETGFMHNRLRMITASFLTKHLLIDWRWGEAWFARCLLDYELASNNGNWQWAAGGGCDAAPYFRVFNPYIQTRKFDPELKYVKKWVPESGSTNYPQPIIEHTFARTRAIQTYKNSLS